MSDGYRNVLVVDLLGGIGDLVMVLPVVHALARRHPDAALRVVTHPPGDALLQSDPAVTETRLADKGHELLAVAHELDRCPPDLVVSTTRFGGIAEEIESRGMRSVTDLWRGPAPDEPVARRYIRILAAEGLVDPGYRPPSVHITDPEVLGADRALVATAVAERPVVLVPGSGMPVKQWPHWSALAQRLDERGVRPLVVAGHPPPQEWAGGLARLLPPTDLRGLAALFAAVARRGGVVVGGDTGPVRVAAAVGTGTVGLFGPTTAARYGLDAPAASLQGLPSCPHRRPLAITEQVCWWDARCPLAADGAACMTDIDPDAVLHAVLRVRASHRAEPTIEGSP